MTRVLGCGLLGGLALAGLIILAAAARDEQFNRRAAVGEHVYDMQQHRDRRRWTPGGAA